MRKDFNQLNIERFKLLLTGKNPNIKLFNNSEYLKNIFIEDSEEMYTLVVLEKLGFEMEDSGTYLYAKLITKIARTIEELPIDILATQLLHDYSQFYFDIGRNELDLGIKTFHKRIIEATKKVDYSKADPDLIYDIFCGTSEKIDYKDQAFLISIYVYRHLNEKRKGKIKKVYYDKV